MNESKLESELRLILEERGIDGFVQELHFHRPRKWAFDFCFEDQKLAVECEGMGRGGGRHRSYTGFRDDCFKYNQAVLDGYRILRFTGPQIKSGYALATIVEALGREVDDKGKGDSGGPVRRRRKAPSKPDSDEGDTG